MSEDLRHPSDYGEQSADKHLTIADIEAIAKDDPEFDWQVRKYGPLRGEIFQRQGDDRWVCVESKQGFS